MGLPLWKDRRWKTIVPYLALALASGAYLYAFVHTYCYAPDAGVFLNGADLVQHGAVPSRDFVEPQGPGSFLWLAFFFRIFGASLETSRWVLNLTGVGMVLLTFHLSRRLGASGVFATAFTLVMSVPLMPINSPHYDTTLAALAALAVFLPAWDSIVNGEAPKTWLLMVTALFCGIATWMIQQKGLYLAVAFLAALSLGMRAKGVRAIFTFGFTYAGIVLALFGVFAMLHALPDLLFANYVWPLKTYNELNATPYGFPLLHDLLADWSQNTNTSVKVSSLAVYIPFFLVTVLPLILPIAAWLAGRKWMSAATYPYWLAAYAVWLGELHRLDFGHLRNGVLLLALLFFSICEACGRPMLRRCGVLLGLCVAIVGCTDLMGSLQVQQQFQTRRGKIYVGDNVALLEFLERHTRSGDEVFVYPYQPIYYFLEDLKNPTRYSYMQYHLHTDEQFREATGDLDRKKVRYVVRDTELAGDRFREVFPAYRHPEKAKQIMEPYLDSHYRVLNDFGRFQILQRRESDLR